MIFEISISKPYNSTTNMRSIFLVNSFHLCFCFEKLIDISSAGYARLSNKQVVNQLLEFE